LPPRREKRQEQKPRPAKTPLLLPQRSVSRGAAVVGSPAAPPPRPCGDASSAGQGALLATSCLRDGRKRRQPPASHSCPERARPRRRARQALPRRRIPPPRRGSPLPLLPPPPR